DKTEDNYDRGDEECGSPGAIRSLILPGETVLTGRVIFFRHIAAPPVFFCAFAATYLSCNELQIPHLCAFRRLASRGIQCRQDIWRQTKGPARFQREGCSARLGVP